MELPPASKTYIVGLIGERLFRILLGAASLVPGLGLAATTALLLSQDVQAAERNKEDFRDLLESCYLIMGALAERADTKNGPEPPHLQEDAARLQEDIKFIEKCVKKYGKKQSLVKKTWKHFLYKRTIEQCQGRLRKALDMFNLKSNIELRQQVAALLNGKARTPSRSHGSQEVEVGSEHPVVDNGADLDDNDGMIGVFAPGGDTEIAGGINYTRAPLNTNGQDPTHQPPFPESPAPLQRPNPTPIPTPQRSRTAPLPQPSRPALPDHHSGDNRTRITRNTGFIGVLSPGGQTRIGGSINMNTYGT